MTQFLQLHLLTFFPPCNLNRDDLGRPKTAVIGGTTRLRISSQALKRAWRSSDIFVEGLSGHMGQRTQRLGRDILNYLNVQNPDHQEVNIKIARDIAGIFGKVKKEDDAQPVLIEQLSFISLDERKAAFALADRMLTGETVKPEKDGILQHTDTAADIALFGRMFADDPSYNREAAAQVAHAITTHKIAVENDYFTAVDDLKTRDENAGAGFISEAGFGSGIFYQYINVNCDLLFRNLGGDEVAESVGKTALALLIRAAAITAPGGKQNSFAALGRAHYILAEKGPQQPRTLAGAFSAAVHGRDLMAASVEALQTYRAALIKVYQDAPEKTAAFEVGGDGTLDEIIVFASEV